MRKKITSYIKPKFQKYSALYISFMYSLIVRLTTVGGRLDIKVEQKDIFEKISNEGVLASLKYILMPTRMGASIIKEKYPDQFANYIKTMTRYYLKLAILFFLFFYIADNLEYIFDWFYGVVFDNYSATKLSYTDNFLLNIILLNKYIRWIGFVLGIFLILVSFSRIFEIFYAFYRDAFTHLESDKNYQRSNLKYFERVHLAMYSYMELVLLFAFVYYASSAICATWVFCDNAFKNVILNIGDAIYFSGVTITTLGYGDIAPNILLSKFLVVFEVLSGFTLIIVSFTIYVSRAMKEIDDENSKKE